MTIQLFPVAEDGTRAESGSVASVLRLVRVRALVGRVGSDENPGFVYNMPPRLLVVGLYQTFSGLWPSLQKVGRPIRSGQRYHCTEAMKCAYAGASRGPTEATDVPGLGRIPQPSSRCDGFNN